MREGRRKGECTERARAREGKRKGEWEWREEEREAFGCKDWRENETVRKRKSVRKREQREGKKSMSREDFGRERTGSAEQERKIEKRTEESR